jgi:hypothetical protein
VTSGGPNTAITVNGGQFLANQPVTLYWDQKEKVAGSATADANGSFTTRVKPFDGDAPAVHKLCASVQPNPCANFNLEPMASPSPSQSPSPSASPIATGSPSANPTAQPSATPVATTLSGFDVITRPPFVFLPLIGILGILLSVGYWILTIVRRPRAMAYPSAAVVHRASRPDYSAEFGTPPPTPTYAPSPTSAWAESVPKTAAPVPPLQRPELEAPPAHEWPELPASPVPSAWAEPAPPPPAADAPPSTEWPELPAHAVEAEMQEFLRPPDEPLDRHEPGK